MQNKRNMVLGATNYIKLLYRLNNSDKFQTMMRRRLLESGGMEQFTLEIIPLYSRCEMYLNVMRDRQDYTNGMLFISIRELQRGYSLSHTASQTSYFSGTNHIDFTDADLDSIEMRLSNHRNENIITTNEDDIFTARNKVELSLPLSESEYFQKSLVSEILLDMDDYEVIESTRREYVDGFVRVSMSNPHFNENILPFAIAKLVEHGYLGEYKL